MKKVFFALLSLFLIDVNGIQLEYYDVHKNIGLDMNTSASFLIDKFKLLDKTTCVVKCNVNTVCKSLLWTDGVNSNRINCYLYAKTFDSTEKINFIGFDLHEKNCTMITTLNVTVCLTGPNNLTHAFQNYRLQHKITNNSMGNLGLQIRGIFEYQDFDLTVRYFVFNLYDNRVLVFNDKFEFLYFKTLINPCYAMRLENDMYVTSDANIQRIDKHGNATFSVTINTGYYRGIEYDENYDQIYVASLRLEIFNRSLVHVGQISISPYTSYALKKFNGLFYIGTTTGTILIMDRNRTIIRNFQTLCNNTITAFDFDQYNRMAIACQYTKIIYLYAINGTFLNQTILENSVIQDIKIDLKGRLLITTQTSINIYY